MSKILFLTSSPDASYPLEDGNWETGPLASKNGLIDRVRAVWPEEPANVLSIASDPANDAMNDEMIEFYTKMLAASGLAVAQIRSLDSRTWEMADEWLAESDFVILSGGHVPTQNAFLQELGLREKLESFDGIIMGISAGTMNSADIVYAQPELPGESIDPDYVRYLRGLNLTKLNILPHYQKVKDNLLDGRRLMEDITYGDSYGHTYYALEDGSYVYSDGETELFCGKTYEIKDGKIRTVCEDGEVWSIN
ncbi:MAG: Type 1 glutamine amidotransferase-like domain-containing protein [Clostridiales bacterium]|nr:Type 1 glutamine amidotransferase-like domain-containing protein [Clostridiales bacterium]